MRGIRYSLFAIRYSLFAIRYSLFTPLPRPASLEQPRRAGIGPGRALVHDAPQEPGIGAVCLEPVIDLGRDALALRQAVPRHRRQIMVLVVIAHVEIERVAQAV